MHLRASQINGCSACVDSGAKTARKAGNSDDRIIAVSAWRESPYFDEAERAALALTEEATRLADKGEAVPDEIWDAAAKHFDEKGMAAVILTIAQDGQSWTATSTSTQTGTPAPTSTTE